MKPSHVESWFDYKCNQMGIVIHWFQFGVDRAIFLYLITHLRFGERRLTIKNNASTITDQTSFKELPKSNLAIKRVSHALDISHQGWLPCRGKVTTILIFGTGLWVVFLIRSNIKTYINSNLRRKRKQNGKSKSVDFHSAQKINIPLKNIQNS